MELQPLCPGGGLRKISFFFFLNCESGQTLEQAAQRGGAVSILGDIQKPFRHGPGNQLCVTLLEQGLDLVQGVHSVLIYQYHLCIHCLRKIAPGGAGGLQPTTRQ